MFYSGPFHSVQGKYDVQILSTDPWVVVFDNFLSDKEVKALVSQKSLRWERSTDTGRVLQ